MPTPRTLLLLLRVVAFFILVIVVVVAAAQATMRYLFAVCERWAADVTPPLSYLLNPRWSPSDKAGCNRYLYLCRAHRTWTGSWFVPVDYYRSERDETSWKSQTYLFGWYMSKRQKGWQSDRPTFRQWIEQRRDASFEKRHDTYVKANTYTHIHLHSYTDTESSTEKLPHSEGTLTGQRRCGTATYRIWMGAKNDGKWQTAAAVSSARHVSTVIFINSQVMIYYCNFLSCMLLGQARWTECERR